MRTALFAIIRQPVAIAVMLMFNTACRPQPADVDAPRFPPPDPAFGNRALRQVADFVALGPRDAGTPGARRAAEWLLARLQADGLEARIDSFTDDTPDGPARFHNVLAFLPGLKPGPGVLLGSHFDTKSGLGPDFQGANDSGSSTGLLLELAHRYARLETPLPYGLTFAFFDGEECRIAYGPNDGLHGSRQLAAQMAANPAERPKAVMVLDMIGDRDLFVTLPPNSSRALSHHVLDAALATGHRSAFGLAAYPILDDHQPFLDQGIPAVLLIDFAYGSAPGRNDYWHTTEDTLDKLSAHSLQIVAEVLVETLNRLQHAD